MKIINLTSTQYKNYAAIHSYKNFGQTLEYARLSSNSKLDKYFLGLIDDNEIIHAATCILVKNISPIYKEAIAKDGFLIDYNDYSLVETFINELKIYLKKLRITCLLTDPVFKYKVYNKKYKLIENNENMLDAFIKLDFKNNGFHNDFAKYDVVIENYTCLSDIYNSFNRNTKRNIKDAKDLGVTLHKGSIKDIDSFYEMVKKKKNLNIDYYKDMMNAYNTNENKMEIFFTKLDLNKFLINSKKKYEKALKENSKIQEKLFKKGNDTDNKLYNKKKNSDALVNKWHETLELATKMNLEGISEITIGTTAIIRNNNEVYFLIDGYNDKYRNIHSSHILKWAIIKKYYEKGYNKFNLGEVHNMYFSKDNKYHNQYMYKIGFGGNVIEYPPEMKLIINKLAYTTHEKLNKK